MALTVEVGPVGDPSFRFGQRDIVSLDIQRVHTAKSDAEVVVPYDAGLRDAFFRPLRIADDGDILFRGEVRDFDWSERDGTTRIRADGIEDVALSNEQVDRNFTNTFTGDAIRDVLELDTGIDVVDVQDPSTQDTVAGQTVIDASTASDFAGVTSLDATDPVRITGDRLETTPVALWREGADAEFTVPTDSTAQGLFTDQRVASLKNSGGTTARYPRDLLHEVPNGNAHIAVRYAYPGDPDGDGDHEGPVWEVKYDGTQVGQFGVANPDGFNPIEANGDPSWFVQPVSGSQSTGRHDLVIDTLGDPSGADPRLYIDHVIVLLDDRFASTVPDNTTDGNATLGGPPEYPDGARIDFAAQTTDYNVTAVDIVSAFSQTTNAQALHAATTGTNEVTASNTETLSTPFPTPSIDVLSGVTFGAADTGGSTTPTLNAPQSLSSLTVSFDGDGRNVIGDQDFSGSALSVVQELADRSDYRFVFVHDSRDGSGDLQTEVRAFKRGTITRPADWAAIDRNPTERADRYANRVTIRGALQDDGTRPTATVEAPSEIDKFGVRLVDAVRPNLTTQDAVLSAARGTLLDRAQRKLKGTIDIPPQVPLPGYAYDVDWFDTGDLDATDLERVEVQERHQEARGTLDFEGDQSIVATVASVGFEVAATKQGV